MITIKGIVVESETGSPIPGANVYVSDEKGNNIRGEGTATTPSGEFSLAVEDDDIIAISHIGRQALLFRAKDLYNKMVELKETSEALDEVTVKPKVKYMGLTAGTWGLVAAILGGALAFSAPKRREMEKAAQKK